MDDLLEKFPATGLRPALLGRNFRLLDDPQTYTVLGLLGRSNKVMLQVASGEDTLSLSAAEFLRRATRIDD